MPRALKSRLHLVPVAAHLEVIGADTPEKVRMSSVGIVSEETHRTLGWPNQTQKDGYGLCLAGAIGPEQSKYLPTGYPQ